MPAIRQPVHIVLGIMDMKVIERGKLLERFEAYVAQCPETLLIASNADGTEETFLESFDRLTQTGSGEIVRVGLKALLAVSCSDPLAAKSWLEKECEGNWCHVVTEVSRHETVTDALREAEWRSAKWAGEGLEKTRFEVI